MGVREDLTYVVLPESAKARSMEAVRAASERRRLARSVMVPAWEPPSELSAASEPTSRSCRQTWLHGGRCRAVLGACITVLLVATAASVSLWRAHEEQVQEARSTCRTAARGLD